MECDAPSAVASGNTLDEACEEMHSLLLDLLGDSLRDHSPFPYASGTKPSNTNATVSFTPVQSLKVFLVNAMIETGSRPIDIAQKLGIPRQGMTRILNPRYQTNLDTLDKAIEATGKHLRVSFA